SSKLVILQLMLQNSDTMLQPWDGTQRHFISCSTMDFLLKSKKKSIICLKPPPYLESLMLQLRLITTLLNKDMNQNIGTTIEGRPLINLTMPLEQLDLNQWS